MKPPSARAPEPPTRSDVTLARIAELEAELRRAQASLREVSSELARVSETAEAMQVRLNLAMSSAGLYWWDWDVKAGLVRHFGANPLFMHSDEESSVVTSEQWRALVNPEDRALADTSIAPCLRGERDDWFCELRLQTTSGDWRWVMIAARA